MKSSEQISNTIFYIVGGDLAHTQDEPKSLFNATKSNEFLFSQKSLDIKMIGNPVDGLFTITDKSPHPLNVLEKALYKQIFNDLPSKQTAVNIVISAYGLESKNCMLAIATIMTEYGKDLLYYSASQIFSTLSSLVEHRPINLVLISPCVTSSCRAFSLLPQNSTVITIPGNDKDMLDWDFYNSKMPMLHQTFIPNTSRNIMLGLTEILLLIRKHSIHDIGLYTSKNNSYSVITENDLLHKWDKVKFLTTKVAEIVNYISEIFELDSKNLNEWFWKTHQNARDVKLKNITTILNESYDTYKDALTEYKSNCFDSTNISEISEQDFNALKDHRNSLFYSETQANKYDNLIDVNNIMLCLGLEVYIAEGLI